MTETERSNPICWVDEQKRPAFLFIFIHIYTDGVTVLGYLASAKVLIFLARSQNREKQLLASSRLSVSPYETARLPLEGFSLNLMS